MQSKPSGSHVYAALILAAAAAIFSSVPPWQPLAGVRLIVLTGGAIQPEADNNPVDTGGSAVPP